MSDTSEESEKRKRYERVQAVLSDAIAALADVIPLGMDFGLIIIDGKNLCFMGSTDGISDGLKNMLERETCEPVDAVIPLKIIRKEPL